MPPGDEAERQDQINRMVQNTIEEIQAHEDAYILAAMERATAAEVYRVWTEGEVTVDIPPLAPGQVVRVQGQEVGRILSISTPNPNHRDIMYLDQQSWDDIVHVGGPSLEGALQAQITLESSHPRGDLGTWPAGYVLGNTRQPAAPEFFDASYVQEPTDPATHIGFTMTERLGVGVVNPRGVRRLQFPEFELASNPTIHLDEVRSRRFDIINRSPHDPHVWLLLEALLRAKVQETAPIRPPGPPRTVWEALLDLDLVDD